LNESKGSADSLIVSNELSVTGASVPLEPTATRNIVEHRKSAEIRNAVYAHIRAIRALGRTTINTSEIATALSLPIDEVNRAVSTLNSKGVKVRKHGR